MSPPGRRYVGGAEAPRRSGRRGPWWSGDRRGPLRVAAGPHGCGRTTRASAATTPDRRPTVCWSRAGRLYLDDDPNVRGGRRPSRCRNPERDHAEDCAECETRTGRSTALRARSFWRRWTRPSAPSCRRSPTSAGAPDLEARSCRHRSLPEPWTGPCRANGGVTALRKFAKVGE